MKLHSPFLFIFIALLFLAASGCSRREKATSAPQATITATALVPAQQNEPATSTLTEPTQPVATFQPTSRPGEGPGSGSTGSGSQLTQSPPDQGSPQPTLTGQASTETGPAGGSGTQASATPTPGKPGGEGEGQQEGSPTPTGAAPTSSPTPEQGAQSSGTTGCVDKATFESDATIPDNTVFHQGDAFVKTWRLYNSGTCAWGPGYSFVFAYGDVMGANPSNPLPETPPGASMEISLNLVAPNGAGQHAGNWQLQNASGDKFGVGLNGAGYIWVQIMVSYISPQGSTAAGSGPITNTVSESSPTGCAYGRNPAFEEQVLAQINNIRASNQLNPLTLNPQLSSAALTYSVDMACNNRVDFTRHTDSNGGRWYERITAQGYGYSVAFENVYVGNPAYGGDPQGAMNWWMNSPIHRDNILKPDVTEIGIAYAFTSTSDFGGYYTVDFARP